MPQSTRPEALQFLQQYQGKQILVQTDAACVQGEFKALEYDRSMIITNVLEFVRKEGCTQAVPEQGKESPGWIVCERRSIVIPGALIKEIFLVE